VFAYFALVMREEQQGGRVTHRQVMILAALGGLIALTKMVYAPLVLAFLLLPRAQFGNGRQRLLAMSFILLVTAAGSLAGAWIAYRADYVERINFPYFQDNSLTPTQKAEWVENKRKDKEQAVATLVNKPAEVLAQAWDMYTHYSFWQRNGRELFVWFINPYPDLLKPLGIVPALLVLLFVGDAGGRCPSMGGRLWLAAACVATLVLLALALYTGGAGGMYRIQGRYFIPLLPFAGLAAGVTLRAGLAARVRRIQLLLGLAVLFVMYLAVFRVIAGTVFMF